MKTNLNISANVSNISELERKEFNKLIEYLNGGHKKSKAKSNLDAPLYLEDEYVASEVWICTEDNKTPLYFIETEGIYAYYTEEPNTFVLDGKLMDLGNDITTTDVVYNDILVATVFIYEPEEYQIEFTKDNLSEDDFFILEKSFKNYLEQKLY